MVQLISIINSILLFILLLFVLFLWIIDKQIQIKILNTNQNIKVINKKNEIESPKQLYNNEVEDYFLNDIYKNLPDDIKLQKFQKDYFDIFIKGIDLILSNKTYFENTFIILNNPSSLKYKLYIPIIKFAKFSIDYEKYLEKLNFQQFNILVEKYYNNFKDDPKYFIIFNNNNCNKRVHILYFIEKAFELYNMYKNKVNSCIYHNLCIYQDKNNNKMQC